MSFESNINKVKIAVSSLQGVDVLISLLKETLRTRAFKYEIKASSMTITSITLQHGGERQRYLKGHKLTRNEFK